MPKLLLAVRSHPLRRLPMLLPVLIGGIIRSLLTTLQCRGVSPVASGTIWHTTWRAPASVGDDQGSDSDSWGDWSGAGLPPLGCFGPPAEYGTFGAASSEASGAAPSETLRRPPLGSWESSLSPTAGAWTSLATDRYWEPAGDDPLYREFTCGPVMYSLDPPFARPTATDTSVERTCAAGCCSC